MICPQCGRENPEDAKFCPGCGNRFEAPAPVASAESPVPIPASGFDSGDIEYVLEHKPAYAIAILDLKPGQSVTAETGAMVSMSPNVSIKTASRGGALKGLKRAMLGGESFFINTFTAENGRGEITLAPSAPGDVVHLGLNGETVFVQSGSFMACSPSISIDTKWAGARGFFSGEGLFLLKASGTGSLFLSSFGGIQRKDLGAGENYVIDTQHMVAFSETVNYKVKRVGGWKSTILSGEGLVAEYAGPGTIYYQTRSLSAFMSLIAPQSHAGGGNKVATRSVGLGGILGGILGIFLGNRGSD